MKHFKYSLDCSLGGSRNKLRGSTVTKENASALFTAYQESDFHYQFQSQDGEPTSRIMNCSTTGELLWLEGEIKNGARVAITPNHTAKRPVFYRQPIHAPAPS